MRYHEQHTANHPRHKLAQALVERAWSVPKEVCQSSPDFNPKPSDDRLAEIFYNPTMKQLDAIFNGTIKGY